MAADESKQVTSVDAQIEETTFLDEAVGIIRGAKAAAKRAVNLSMVYAYFEIGRIIVEQEQGGESRAEYGAHVIERLSERLTAEFGRGFSTTNLKQMKQFFQVYGNDQIGQTLSDQFKTHPTTSTGRRFFLSWSHYIRLMRIKNSDARHFYEIEAVRGDWSLSELNRQLNSALFERLALSRDKEEVKRLASEGEMLESPTDALRDPYVLEFLNLKGDAGYSETDLESRIIDHLQEFMLELGRGFAFMARQKRFTFAEDHFRVDLVFYNRLLRCFVLVDLKLGKLTHQDLGQMQMYVNYYDRTVKLDDENPTIGILICGDKNDAVVEMTLPEDNGQIFASKYETVLPSKEELRRLVEECRDA